MLSASVRLCIQSLNAVHLWPVIWQQLLNGQGFGPKLDSGHDCEIRGLLAAVHGRAYSTISASPHRAEQCAYLWSKISKACASSLWQFLHRNTMGIRFCSKGVEVAYLDHASGGVTQEGQVVQHILQHWRLPGWPRVLQGPLTLLHWPAPAVQYQMCKCQWLAVNTGKIPQCINCLVRIAKGSFQ